MKRIWITALCAVLCSCFFAANAVDAAAAYTVQNGLDQTNMLESTASSSFGLWQVPQVESNDPSVEAGLSEKFPNGLWLYQVYDPSAEPCYRYGLLDRDGTVLLQPDYYSIYMLDRCRGSVGAITEREPLGNILILADESHRLRIFRCTGGAPGLLEDSYDLIGGLDWITVCNLSPEERIETLSDDGAHFYENFIPVYREDSGYGLIGFDGEPLVPCSYDRYEILSPTRIALYQTDSNGDRFCDLYDTEGNRLSRGQYTLNPFSEGLTVAELADGTIRILSPDGSPAFTLPAYYTPLSDHFSDGLLQVRATGDGKSFVAYLDTNGNQVLSLQNFEETYNVSLQQTGNFANGISYLTSRIYDNDWSAFFFTTAGDVRSLKYHPYYVVGYNGYSLVDTDGDNTCDNVMNKWGNLLFAGPYTVRLCNNAFTLENEDCHWIAITNTDTALTAYFNLDTKYCSDFVYTDTDYPNAVVYDDVQYLPVNREGKHGVLGSNAKEIVPAVYDSVFLPDGQRAHFTALRRISIGNYQSPRVTIYGIDGTLKGELDQFDQKSSYNAASSDSGFGYLYSNNDFTYTIITPTGETKIPKGDCSGLNGRRFSGGLLQAEYYDWSADPLVHTFGFLTEEGDFLPLADAENSPLPFDFYNTVIEMNYGSYTNGTVVLYYQNWSPACFLSVDKPSQNGRLQLLKSNPADGQNYISRGLDCITLEFNQEILLQDANAIQLTCDLGPMSFHASANGNKLHIYPDRRFYTGEVYTLTVDESALSAANSSSQISYFDGAEIQYKITGVSSKMLLTYHPEYLLCPDSIDFIYENATMSLEKMMDVYCGKEEFGEVISAFFYAAKNLNQLTADKLNDLFGGAGTSEQLQKSVLDLFISRACVDTAVTMDKDDYAGIKTYINFCKNWDEIKYGMKISSAVESGLFETAARESGAIDPLTDTMDSLMMEDLRTILNFCTSHKSALEKAWSANQSLTELKNKTMDDLLGEYSMTLFNYVHLNRIAIDSLLSTLSPDSELYEGLKARRDALSGNALASYLAEMLQDEAFETFVSKSADLLFELTGKSGIKAMNCMVDIANNLYQSVTGKCDVDKYIQVIMMNGHAIAVSTAAMEAQARMFRSVQSYGETTPQQRNDFKVAINAKQQAYSLLMEMAAELVSDPETLSRECLIWAEEIESNCAFPEYLELCKANAAHLAQSEVFPENAPSLLYLQDTRMESYMIPIPDTTLLDEGRPDTQLLIQSGQGPETGFSYDDIESVMFTGTTVRSGAFEGWSNLTHVLLGNVTQIGSRAFAGCAISEITIPDTVTTIAADSFADTPLSLVAGTTNVAREFASSVNADYLDLTVSPITVLHAGYDADGKILFVVSSGDPVPDCAPTREVLFILSETTFIPVAPSL